jgi:hypothetical protein
MFASVLIANRGEIAYRIIRTLKRMGIASVGVASDADRFTLPMRLADGSCARAGRVAETYLNIDAIVDAARDATAEAVHPGYGFPVGETRNSPRGWSARVFASSGRSPTISCLRTRSTPRAKSPKRPVSRCCLEAAVWQMRSRRRGSRDASAIR